MAEDVKRVTKAMVCADDVDTEELAVGAIVSHY